MSSPSAPILLIVAGTTACIYLFLITILRLVGRRQLAQLSALDLVVVLLLGSTVETAMIHGDTSLAAGLVSAGMVRLSDIATLGRDSGRRRLLERKRPRWAAQ